MPGRGGESCGRALWGDCPRFTGLPEPQWAADLVPPSHRAWGLMLGGIHLPSSRGVQGHQGFTRSAPFAWGSHLALLGCSTQG